MNADPRLEAELDRRLAAWAAARRAGADDLDTIRAQILARVTEPVVELERESAFDPDWLWSLLRPVTALIEQTPADVSERVERWLQPLTGDRSDQPYLRLA